MSESKMGILVGTIKALGIETRCYLEHRNAANSNGVRFTPSCVCIYLLFSLALHKLKRGDSRKKNKGRL